MNTLYLECQMGAAGDMLTAALLELFDHPESKVDELNRLGIPDVEYRLEHAKSHGIHGLRVHVYLHGEEEKTCDIHAHEQSHPHGHHHANEAGHDDTYPHQHEHQHEHQPHHHTTLSDIQAIVRTLKIDAQVQADILSIYTYIAEAESSAHGVNVEEVHFHEVGTMDAVADITAVCYLLHQLHPDNIVCSAIHVGCGHVHCAHGILPVPAPATAWLLRGIPCYGGSISGELCTPTGAAIIRHFADAFGTMPSMRIAKIGYGMGHKIFSSPNCVRAFLGHTSDESDQIIELSCNIDDMTPEDLAFAQEQLFSAGAVEVYTTSVSMKKSRSAFILTVHAPISSRQFMLETIFRHTSTIGIRENICQRYTLERHLETITTRYGSLRVKRSTGYGVERIKYEYEDLSRIAREHDITLESLKHELNTMLVQQQFRTDKAVDP